jgi:alpha-amylase/alpha-mannosidase (GH57 family)
MRQAQLCFLLHMHQPEYVDPLTGRAELPWVRLHGARAYLDVASLLEEFEHIRLTVNFVPSLVAQLEQVVNGAKDAWLQIAQKNDWTPEERDFLVERFFSLHWGRSVDPRPRYRELLEKRGRHPRADELALKATAFSKQDLRDLTVLFYLSWIGFAARKQDPDLITLEEKGRNFTDDDFALVVERQRLACAKVLPLYRKLGERGQIELSASPYFHPIVPLLVDTQHARRARPDLPQPSQFSFPEDGAAQIARGAAAHEKTFGARPLGMWPPEGSVSPEAVHLYRANQIGWLATDEGNLWRSLGAAGKQGTRGDLYRPWKFDGVNLLFRDREMSDRIGFSYSHGEAAAGADDLLARAHAAAAASTAPDEPLVSVFLDGENPWEAYPGSGEPFLRALFERLRNHPQVRTATISEHLSQAKGTLELPLLHSGSWIDSDFHIWIGDPIKNRAWDLLGAARRRWERARASGVDETKLQKSYDHLLAAEGSDWFWWFGEPFHSAEDSIFDRLFRAHLRGAYAALDEPAPPALDEPVSRAAASANVTAPWAFISPHIAPTGRPPAFYAWHGAGRYEIPRGAAMAEQPLVDTIHFGFDASTLYLRLDPAPSRARELEGATLEIDINVEKRQLRLTVVPHEWQLDEAVDHSWRPLGRGGPAALHRSLELGIPFSRLGVNAADRLELSFRLRRGELILARYPADGSLAVQVPDSSFEADHWSA